MKKWIPLFILSLSLLSSFGRAVDDDPKTIEENSRSISSSSSSSSSSFASA